MRPAHNTTSTADTTAFRRWNSPIPYLFGGLALMLGLIAVALVILACSYKKYSRENRVEETDRGEKPEVTPVHVMKPEMEPKFVVILAGDHEPTCLAKPALCARSDLDV